MGVSLVAITVTLTLHLSGATITSAQLDVNPLIAIPVHTNLIDSLTVPGFLLYDPGSTAHVDGMAYGFDRRVDLTDGFTVPHELHHYEQQAALGPAFWVAYALTLGEPFEPYDRRTRAALGWREAWMPLAEAPQSFPLFRVSVTRDVVTFSLLPGYPHITLTP